MKKLFTSLMLMGLALGASAQSFTVKGFGGTETYQNGDVVNIYPEQLMSGDTPIPGYYTWDPELEIVANEGCSVTATLVNTNIIVQFCGLDNQCKTGKSITKTKYISKGDSELLRIDIAMSSALTEDITSTLFLTDGEGTDVNLTLVFHKDEAGIQGATVAANRVSMSGRTLNYSVEGSANLTLYTIAGQPAISRRISGQGTLSLKAIPAGVYIYRLGQKTGKLIVR